MSDIAWFLANSVQAVIISDLMNKSYVPVYQMVGFISSGLFVYSGYVGLRDIKTGFKIHVSALSLLASALICKKLLRPS